MARRAIAGARLTQALVVALVLAGSAQAAQRQRAATDTSRPASLTTGATSKPGNRWSGYVVTGRGVSYSRVDGTWTAPAVTCVRGAAPALSTVWVGLGGYSAGAGRLEQVGTDANCDAAGHATYFAWFELLPDVAHTIEGKVEAGDTIRGSVRLVAANLVELEVRNLTRHWRFTRQITSGLPDTSSAEWVVEAPYGCLRFVCRQAALANFGSVAFRALGAVGDGSRAALGALDWRTTRLRLEPCNRTVAPSGAATGRGAPSERPGAAPSRATAGGTGFAVAWLRATRGDGACTSVDSGTVGGLPDYTTG